MNICLLPKLPDKKIFAIKPMNCPGCIQIFNQGLKSYRDLPLRLSEFGKVHRYEPSGALHGLLRVRAFTQDDAHIFCTEDQITDESLSVTNLILEIYKDLGFENVILQFSDRPKKRVGDDKIWDKSESALLKAIKQSKLKYEINKGEGAFYGPKIDFVLRDTIGRDWQCGTLQVDLNLPSRLGATYIDSAGSKKSSCDVTQGIIWLFREIYWNFAGTLCWEIAIMVITSASSCSSYYLGI